LVGSRYTLERTDDGLEVGPSTWALAPKILEPRRRTGWGAERHRGDDQRGSLVGHPL